MIKKVLAVCMVVFCVCGCQTTKVKDVTDGERSMYAMVYDYDNVGVANVTVYVNGEYAGESDVQGRFILDLEKEEDYEISLRKSGYETLIETVTFDPMLVLYFKMGNADQFLFLAEFELDSGNASAALDYVNRAIGLDEARPDALYLKAVVLHAQKKYDESDAVLKQIDLRDSREQYIRLLQEKNRSAGEKREE